MQIALLFRLTKLCFRICRRAIRFPVIWVVLVRNWALFWVFLGLDKCGWLRGCFSVGFGFLGLGCFGGFYNFTIITNGTHQIITLRMTPTTIPAERSLSFIFTTFADVARHASCTRWHPVSRLKCNVLPAPDLLLSPLSPTAGSRSSSHFHVGLTRQLCLLPPAPKPLTPRRQPTATHAAVPELTHGQATHATGAELAAGRPHRLQLGLSTPWPGHLHRQAKLAGQVSGRPPLAS